MNRITHRSTHGAVAAALVFASIGSAAFCCPLCGLGGGGERFSDRIAKSPLVIYGSLSNAKIHADPSSGEPSGTTDMKILRVIKSHPALPADAKKTQLIRYLPVDVKPDTKWVVFADVRDNQVDPFYAVPNDPEGFVEYIEGSIKVAKGTPEERLGYYFKHLGHKDENISRDAYMEFAAAPFADVKLAAKHYQPDQVIEWLKAKDTQPYKMGLMGMLLGVRGRPQDAQVLREIIDTPEQHPLTGIDGIMGGYCMLDPKRGPDKVMEILCNSKHGFSFRFSALRAAEFLLTDMPNIDKKTIVNGFGVALKSSDISDMIIEKLRRFKIWDHTDAILADYRGYQDKVPSLIKRTTVQYALVCPDAAARKFLDEVKKQDPQFVAIEEENLRWEDVQRQQAAAANKPAQ